MYHLIYHNKEKKRQEHISSSDNFDDLFYMIPDESLNDIKEWIFPDNMIIKQLCKSDYYKIMEVCLET